MEPRRRTCHVCFADMSVRLQDDDGAPKPGVGGRVRVGRNPLLNLEGRLLTSSSHRPTEENARWVGWCDHAGVTKEAGELGGAFGPHTLIRGWGGRGATQNTALLRPWLQAEPGASFPGAGNILAAGAFHIAP